VFDVYSHPDWHEAYSVRTEILEAGNWREYMVFPGGMVRDITMDNAPAWGDFFFAAGETDYVVGQGGPGCSPAAPPPNPGIFYAPGPQVVGHATEASGYLVTLFNLWTNAPPADEVLDTASFAGASSFSFNLVRSNETHSVRFSSVTWTNTAILGYTVTLDGPETLTYP
jgi:hypothetical protein